MLTSNFLKFISSFNSALSILFKTKHLNLTSIYKHLAQTTSTSRDFGRRVNTRASRHPTTNLTSTSCARQLRSGSDYVVFNSPSVRPSDAVLSCARYVGESAPRRSWRRTTTLQVFQQSVKNSHCPYGTLSGQKERILRLQVKDMGN